MISAELNPDHPIKVVTKERLNPFGNDDGKTSTLAASPGELKISRNVSTSPRRC